MNINIEPFYAYIKREHLFAYQSNFGEYESVYVFAARSVANRAMLFHCMTESGMQRANVPISALVHKRDAPQIDLDHLQLWNCFGPEMTVCKFGYLAGSRCQVVLKDRSWHWATYVMTFDWENNSYSLSPGDYKNAHLLQLDNGCFALQPNNRIYWRDSNFITQPLDTLGVIPNYKVDKDVFACERSDRWTSEHSDSYYYDIIPALKWEELEKPE
jgi:hypothetical protein